MSNDDEKTMPHQMLESELSLWLENLVYGMSQKDRAYAEALHLLIDGATYGQLVTAIAVGEDTVAGIRKPRHAQVQRVVEWIYGLTVNRSDTAPREALKLIRELMEAEFADKAGPER